MLHRSVQIEGDYESTKMNEATKVNQSSSLLKKGKDVRKVVAGFSPFKLEKKNQICSTYNGPMEYIYYLDLLLFDYSSMSNLFVSTETDRKPTQPKLTVSCHLDSVVGSCCKT